MFGKLVSCGPPPELRDRGRPQQPARCIARGRRRSSASTFCMESGPVYCRARNFRLAGGVDDLAREGAYSVRVAWDDVVDWAPSLMPCACQTTGARARQIFALPEWSAIPAVRTGRVFAVDANAYFARPGPRVIDGTELLAHLIHPDRFAWNGPAATRIARPGPRSGRAMTPGAGMFHRSTVVKTCSSAGRVSICGPRRRNCWCGDLPPIRLHGGQDCLCPRCLAIEMSLQKPNPVDPATPVSRPRCPTVEGIGLPRRRGGRDTAAYHLRRVAVTAAVIVMRKTGRPDRTRIDRQNSPLL